MKKIAFYMIASMLMMSGTFAMAVNTVTSIKGHEKTAANDPSVTPEEKVRILLFRLHEIKTMDKSNLTALEKKVLRKEVRFLKHQFREIYRGSYISVGSVLVTELFLIF